MRPTVVALLASLIAVTLPSPAAAQRDGWFGSRNDPQYDNGYRDGLRDGERDARDGRPFDYNNDRRLSRRGEGFQRGYSDGYRAGYERYRGQSRNSRIGGWDPGPGRVGRGRYQDPAFARGYSEGFEKGLDDGRDRDRYDPVRHRDYRDADDGYFRDYGAKQAYENNFRAGFRQGYEEGYRDGTRSRR